MDMETIRVDGERGYIKMRKQPIVWLALTLFLSGTVAGALSTGDSLVSRSYVLETYINSVSEKAKNTAGALGDIKTKIDGLAEQVTADILRGNLEAQVVAALGKSVETKLHAGNTVTVQEGTEVIVNTGQALSRKGTWINLSTGKEVGTQHALVTKQRYLSADDDAELTIVQDSVLMISGKYQTGTSTTEIGTHYTDYADALHSLGLFQGSQKGYELTRPATRLEGLVMLIRLLGDESKAKAFQGKHPFTDVPAWANTYVAYAYDKGYTSGISKTQFGSTMQLRYLDYMTFLLRALGYSDHGGDFQWNTADQAAVDHGIQTAAERAEIKKQGRFLRDHVAYTSYRTLFAKNKDGIRLCDVLIQHGVFTQKQLEAVEQKGL